MLRTLRPMLVSATIVTALISSTLATAQDGRDKWFGAIKASIGDVQIDSISHGGGIGTGTLINGQIDGQLEDTTFDDYTAGLGVSLGRRMGNWQLETEFVYRYRTDWDLVAPTPSIQTITNVFSNIETNTLMFNVARRGVVSQFWSWELGAGIGLVQNDIEGDYIERRVPGIRPELVFKDDQSDTDFTYNVFAGVTRELGRTLTLNIRYRYIDLGDLEIGPFPNRPARATGEHTAQELQFSIERTF